MSLQHVFIIDKFKKRILIFALHLVQFSLISFKCCFRKCIFLFFKIQDLFTFQANMNNVEIIPPEEQLSMDMINLKLLDTTPAHQAISNYKAPSLISQGN